jgi:rubrerythrin
MSILFNADEVFEMAIRTEENGAAFYRRAAELHSDQEGVKFLLALAEMEDGHKKTFQEMRSALTAKEKAGTVYDPNNEAVLYLDAMADSSGGEGSPKVADSLTGQESMADILKTAIDLEKNSILFYLGLLELVPARLGRDKVEGIIKEERGHVAELAKELRKHNA